jgi:hemerythrin-like domain-containing protein
MRVPRNLQTDQDNIARFLTTLGGASTEVRTNKRAKAKFFLRAHEFIKDYIDEGFFRKEEVIISILEDGGFPLDSGPIGAIRSDQKKCRQSAQAMLDAVTIWQDGNEKIRPEVGSVSHEYTSTLRQHMERLKNLIYPLVDQTMPIEAEEKVTEEIKSITFEGGLKDGVEKYVKLIQELEEEYADWK